MAIKKVYSKNKPECKVTFSVPVENVPEKAKLFLAGEFNNWEETSLRMAKRNGEYIRTLVLPTGTSYQFKYNVDGQYWINDDAADSYPQNTFGGDNSQIDL